MAKSKSNKQKGKAKAVEPAEAPVGMRVVIDLHLEQAIERGGHVPPMVKDVPEGAHIKARGLVAHWRLHYMQVFGTFWRQIIFKLFSMKSTFSTDCCVSILDTSGAIWHVQATPAHRSKDS